MNRNALLGGSLIVVALFAPGAQALAPPHDASHGIDCLDCHVVHPAPAEIVVHVTDDAGSTTMLVDSTQTWVPQEWIGGRVHFMVGANAGLAREVRANTENSLIWLTPLPVPVAAGDAYHVARSVAYETQTVCETCHNPTGSAASMTDLSLHITSNGEVIGCSKCHDPHGVASSSAQGTGIIRSAVLWPTANNPTTHPVPAGNSMVVAGEPYNGICETCHTQTAHHRNDASGDHGHFGTAGRCMACHSHQRAFAGYDHEAENVIQAIPACMTCHPQRGTDVVGDVHGDNCGSCHVAANGAGPLVEPYESTFPSGGTCVQCHSHVNGNHTEVAHIASPGTGWVAIHEDFEHDSVNWGYPSPQFAVDVDCAVGCHSTSLLANHANNCWTCHETAVQSLTTWNGTCQQGGCHAVYHADSTEGHAPWEDSGGPWEDCLLCHPNVGWWPTQTQCYNCHNIWSAGSLPPVTTSDAQASYLGAAEIRLSATDNGKVCACATFYRVDGGEVVAGSEVFETGVGAHVLEFWSVDQEGSTESPPNQVAFEVIEDLVAPVTVSNVVALYWNRVIITLSASDAGGVAATHYELNGGGTQTGAAIDFFPPWNAVTDYTLEYWSVDRAGNEEDHHFAAFTAKRGQCTIRMIWGDSDVLGSPCPGDPEADMEYFIYRGGTQVAHGTDWCDWSGVTEAAVYISPVAHTVSIDWWDSWYGWWDNSYFSDVSVTTPGCLVELHY